VANRDDIASYLGSRLIDMQRKGRTGICRGPRNGRYLNQSPTAKGETNG
jgi:hypothetical protein